MNPDPPLDRSSHPLDPLTDLSQVFKHPQGLPTARALVVSFLSQAQNAAKTGPPPQPQPTSLLASGPVPSMNSTEASILDDLLAFRDSHPQTAGEWTDGSRHVMQGARDQTHEMPDKSRVELSPARTAVPFSNIGDDHTSRPQSGPYSPTPFRSFTGSSSQAQHLAHSRPANSLPPFHPIEPGTSIQDSSVSSMWGSDESLPVEGLSQTTPRSNTQLTAPVPSAGFVGSRQSRFAPLRPMDTASKKRKIGSGEDQKQKPQKMGKPKRSSDTRTEKKESVFDHNIYMRILEFTPPAFLSKARLISKDFKGYVDSFTSIYVNCRKENFGFDMPPPPKGLSERQYSRLLGGQKGCLEPDCDDKKASRTHWSWSKRWCWDCWKSKIEREDRVLKSRGILHGRTTLTKILECIPVGMHDSFMKPHDYIDDVEMRPRGAPRLYKYYLTEDINQIMAEYAALSPPPFVENPNHSPAEKAAALAAHQALMDGLEDKRGAFLAAKKAENDEHMAQVQKIEAGIRMRRVRNRNPYDENRNARKELFSRRAREDLPHIDTIFVESTKAYKAATRIFRDPGTERGWLTLKPKIVAAWEAYEAGKDINGAGLTGMSSAINAKAFEAADDGDEPSTRIDETDESEHRITSLDPYFRLQNYQAQLERLEQNKQSHRQFVPFSDILPVSSEANYMNSGMPGSQSSFSSSIGSSSTFAGSTLSAMALPSRRTVNSSGSQLLGSQPLSSSHPPPPSHYFPQSSLLNSNSNSSQGSPHNPSTQISITSLLRPPTPTTSSAKFNHFA